MVIYTKEECVEYNGDHDHVLKCLWLYNTEALQSEDIDWLNWNKLWISHHKQSHDLNPFFLGVSEISRALPLLNLFIELIDNDRNEQVNNEEGDNENVHDI